VSVSLRLQKCVQNTGVCIEILPCTVVYCSEMLQELQLYNLQFKRESLNIMYVLYKHAISMSAFMCVHICYVLLIFLINRDMFIP
jgi:hypothetical protein